MSSCRACALRAQSKWNGVHPVQFRKRCEAEELRPRVIRQRPFIHQPHARPDVPIFPFTRRANFTGLFNIQIALFFFFPSSSTSSSSSSSSYLQCLFNRKKAERDGKIRSDNKTTSQKMRARIESSDWVEFRNSDSNKKKERPQIRRPRAVKRHFPSNTNTEQYN